MADAGLRRRHRLHARLLQRAPGAQLARIQRHLAGGSTRRPVDPATRHGGRRRRAAIAFLDDLLLMSLGKPVDRLAKHSQEPAHME